MISLGGMSNAATNWFASISLASSPVLEREAGWRLKIIKRGQRAFKIAGLTRIAKRTFAWLGRSDRLNKDYEYRVRDLGDDHTASQHSA